MAIGNFFKFILGSKAQAISDPVVYKGFTIEAMPIDEDGKYRTAGYISGELDGEIKRIQFIRADQNASQQMAVDHSIAKAQQIIDEQGEKLLQKSLL
ncbi:MAG: HlyU family transcriptional regulator [Gammaproteobacteria bacterium]|nr:HlyU family transcriptional regulator [Gammaproteobacteria bacterium]